MSNELKIIERLAGALKKLTTSASSNVGADCMLQAQLAQRLLQEAGIEAKLVVGESAWRVGPGDGDVITHSPQIGGYAPAGAKALAYHAWLEMGSTILDFTTHTLSSKAESLDAMDGGRTTVAWCPSYLVMPKGDTLPLKDVVQAPQAGVACYQELPGLYEAMVEQGLCKEVDQDDLRVLRLIFGNPEMVVIGPNDQIAAG